MIDFSQYPELALFTVSEPVLDEPDRIIPEYDEMPFGERRLKYINYLSIKTTSLKDKINNTIAGFGTGPGDGAITNALNIVEILTEASPESYFFEDTLKIGSGNCLGTDMVYDFYRNTLEFASQVEGLKRYDETYITVFEEAYLVADQIFSKIGTRGQLYGYLDAAVFAFGEFLDTFISDLTNATTWADANTVVNTRYTEFNTKYNTFGLDVIEGASDMQLLVDPVVRFLNIILKGSDAINQSWGSFAMTEKVLTIVNQFNVTAAEFQNDYHILDAAVTSQIFEQLRSHITDDGSNFELMIMKAIRMSFDQMEITQELEIASALIVIPNYNP